mmetsp:Transcript_21518/g.47738  ORF Transcript_21518/g.47738 Transcript_21518/m.47738 type:complete len:196 (+) Transcript_21518:154-741(+)
MLRPFCCTPEDCGIRDTISKREGHGRDQAVPAVIPDLAKLNLQQLRRIQMEGRPEPPRPFSIRSGSRCLSEEQKVRDMRKLQDMIGDFVKAIAQGVILDVVLEDGTTEACQCHMDARLTVLTIQLHGRESLVPLAEITEIRSGHEIAAVLTSTPLDSLCATLLMTKDRCVSIRFKDESTREYFATSMKVLRLALE